MAGLKLRNVRKSFDRVEILHGIDLDISDGEFVVIVGPSGCGKSTVLRLIAGLEEITSGDLWIGDKRVNDLPPARRGISMVFQSYALYPHMTVFENMAFGMKLARARRDEIEERVRGAAAMLELSSLLERRPRELSGGQRQRVAIGRAIVRDPKVFLFDEPLSNLDASLRTQMRAEIARLQDHLGVTTVYVTHDQVEAMTLADRIVVLRDGVVEQVGAPLDLYHRPATQFVAGFIGSPQMNFVEVELTEIAGGHGTLTLRGGGQVELPLELGATKCAEPRVLGIRPEHLTPSDESGLDATVELVEELGEAHHLHVVLRNGERMIVKGNGRSAAKAGNRIMLSIDVASAHLFDEGGIALPRPSPSASTMVLGRS